MNNTSKTDSELIGQLLATGIAEQGFCSALPVGLRPQLIASIHQIVADEQLLRDHERDLGRQVREGQHLSRINAADRKLAPCLDCAARAGLHRLSDEELVGLFITPGQLRLIHTMVEEILEIGDPISIEWQSLIADAAWKAETLSKVPILSLVSPEAYLAARKVAQALLRGRKEPGFVPNYGRIESAIKFRLRNEGLAMQRLVCASPQERQEACNILQELSDRMEELSSFESEDDVVEYLACDIEWHITLLQLGGARYAAMSLPVAYEELNVELRSLETSARRMASVEEHRVQEQWLLDGDFQKAVRSVYLHLATAAKQVLFAHGALLDFHEELQRQGETMAIFLGPDLYVELAEQEGLAFWWSGNPELCTPIEYDHFNHYVAAMAKVARQGTIVYFDKESSSGKWFDDFVGRINDHLESASFPRTAQERILRIVVPEFQGIDWECWKGTHAVFLFSKVKKLILTERRVDAFGRTDTCIRSVPATPENIATHSDQITTALEIAIGEGVVQAKSILDRFRNECLSADRLPAADNSKQPIA